MSVQIAIDNYDDLFSDFDIRDYSERYISSDFLNELRMRINKIHPTKAIEITLIIPETERNRTMESTISSRLTTFFNDRFTRNKAKKKLIIFKMLLFELIGIAFLLLANLLESHTPTYLKEFLLIPSWFFIWNGLEKYMNNSNIIRKSIDYYSHLVQSTITFKSA